MDNKKRNESAIKKELHILNENISELIKNVNALVFLTISNEDFDFTDSELIEKMKSLGLKTDTNIASKFKKLTYVGV